MREIVERVIAAATAKLVAEAKVDGVWVNLSGNGLIEIDGVIDLKKILLAAVEAMREPTITMIDAAYPLAGGAALAPIFRAMIDAALKE